MFFLFLKGNTNHLKLNIMKNRNKKLALNKKTITTLAAKEVSMINGGFPVTAFCTITDLVNFSKDTLCTSDAK